MKHGTLIGLIIILALIAAMAVFYFIGQNRIQVLSEKIYALENENDTLYSKIASRDMEIFGSIIRISSLKDSLSTSEAEIMGLKSDLNTIKRDYGNLADSIGKIPVDESYRFLTQEAYPYEGELLFPFNEPQVNRIHIAFLENVSLIALNINLEDQIGRREYQLAIKDTITQEQATQISLMNDTRNDMEIVIENRNTTIEEKNGEIKKERRRKRFWQITGGVAIIAVAILAGGA